MPLIKTEKKIKEPSWVTYIKGRIAKKRNFLMQISGPTGSGKSWSALSIALMLDDTFGPERIIFGFRSLMQLINSGIKFKAGSVFVWDEFQIEAGARDWQSLANKLLNSLLTTFRNKFFILIITAPYTDFIDSQSRKLLHAEFLTQKIDYKEKKTRLKPQVLQYNSRNKKFYYKYLRVKTKRGITPIVAWNVPKPPEWIIDEYERMKLEFTTKLNKEIEIQLDRLEAKKSGQRTLLTPLQEDCMKLKAKYGDTKIVAEKMGLTVRTINFHISQAHKKGWKIEEFGEDYKQKTEKTTKQEEK